MSLLSKPMTSKERYDLVKKESAEYRSVMAKIKEIQGKMEIIKRVRKELE